MGTHQQHLQWCLFLVIIYNSEFFLSYMNGETTIKHGDVCVIFHQQSGGILGIFGGGNLPLSMMAGKGTHPKWHYYRLLNYHSENDAHVFSIAVDQVKHG